MEKISILTVVCKNQTITDFDEFMTSFKSTITLPFELIIVDNGTDDSFQIKLKSICDMDDRIRIIRFPFNVGLGIAADTAVHSITTPYIFRIDSDVIFKTYGWADKILELSKKLDSVGSMCGRNVTTISSVNDLYVKTDVIIGYFQYVPKSAINIVSTFFRNVKLLLINELDKRIEKNENKYPNYFKHLVQLKTYFDRCEGYWDPNFFYGVDDFDYSLLLRYCGLNLYMVNNIGIFHKSTSEKSELKDIRHTTVSEGFRYFRTKWELIRDVLGDKDNIIFNQMSKIFGDFK